MLYLRKVLLTKSGSLFVRDKTPLLFREDCYTRTMTARVQLPKNLVVMLKGLDVKMK
jgi:hypothetical protein